MKSWKEKYESRKEPEVKKLNKSFADMDAGDMMLIPTPKLIDGYLRTIPAGNTVEIKTMRKDLALEHGAFNACPLTTGIFTRIVSELAYEELSEGKDKTEVAPFWRVVDSRSKLASKLSFEAEEIEKFRKSEQKG